MVNIQKILGNEQYDVFIQKVNDNFIQIAQLNGGPRGLRGGSGQPGLPGGQGRNGIKGDDGVNGTRIFFTTPDNSNLYPGTPRPAINDLPTLIANKTYNIGDSFVENTKLYKIVETIGTPIAYDYQVSSFAPTTTQDTVWTTYPLENNITFLGAADEANPGNEYVLRNAYVSYRDYNSGTFGGSNNTDILVHKKPHFKLGLTNTSAPIGSEFRDADIVEISSRIPNMYDAVNYLQPNYEDINVVPITIGSVYNPDLSKFDYIRTAAPVLYLEGHVRKEDNTLSEDPILASNFGVFIQKLKDPLKFGNDTQYKSVLIISSEKNNNNDIYLKVKKVWSEGSFISEANEQTSAYDRYYSTIVSASNFSATPIKTNFGIASYTNDGNGDNLKLMTGVEIVTTATGTHAGSINIYNGNNNAAGNLIKTDADTARFQSMRIDENGAIAFISGKDIAAAYDTVDIASTYKSKYYFGGVPTWHSGIADAIFKTEIKFGNGTGTPEYFAVFPQTPTSNPGISLGIRANLNAKSYVELIRPDQTYSKIREQQYAWASTVTTIQGRSAYISNIGDTFGPNYMINGHIWGIQDSYTLGFFRYTDNHTIPSENYLWLKSTPTAQTSASYKPTNPTDKSVALFLDNARFQMTPDSTNVLGKVLTSKTADGIAQWQSMQTIVGKYEYFDLSVLIGMGFGVNAATGQSISKDCLYHIFEWPIWQVQYDNVSIPVSTLDIVLPTYTLSNIEENLGEEHTIIFSTVDSTKPVLNLSSTTIKIVFNDINNVVQTAYTLTQKDKKIISAGNQFLIKLKLIKYKSAYIHLVSQATKIYDADKYKWRIVTIENLAQSGGSTSDITYDDNTYINIQNL